MGKPEVGEKVRIRCGVYDDSPWVFANVLEHLSAQFLAGDEQGKVYFGLYNAEGESWKRGW